MGSFSQRPLGPGLCGGRPCVLTGREGPSADSSMHGLGRRLLTSMMLNGVITLWPTPDAVHSGPCDKVTGKAALWPRSGDETEGGKPADEVGGERPAPRFASRSTPIIFFLKKLIVGRQPPAMQFKRGFAFDATVPTNARGLRSDAHLRPHPGLRRRRNVRGPRARPGSREPSEGRAPGRGSERRPWTAPRGGRATRHGGRRPGVPGGWPGRRPRWRPCAAPSPPPRAAESHSSATARRQQIQLMRKL